MSSFINGLQIKPKAGGIMSCFNYSLTGMLSVHSVSCIKGSVNLLLLFFFLALSTLQIAEHNELILIELSQKCTTTPFSERQIFL